MEQYHPIINLIYFGLVIGCSMVFLHPVCLFISISCAACYTVALFGWKRGRKGFLGVGLLMLLTALINPTFSHQGVTELVTLPSGNMLTLESILFGIGAAFMLGATLLWFRIVSEILTSDKIVYLFGRTFPILGLLLSMILGFIPKVRQRYSEISVCRKQELSGMLYSNTMTGSRKNGGWRRLNNIVSRSRFYATNISIMITWLLEDSVEMGKSMKGRGYGLPGRTQYTIYRFTKRDRRMLLFMVASGGYVIIGSIRGALSWYYYPVTMGAGADPYSVSVYIAYALLCASPAAEKIRNNIWFKEMRMDESSIS